MSKRNIGSSIDGLLKDEGVFEEAQAQAIEEVAAWKRRSQRNASDRKLLTESKRHEQPDQQCGGSHEP